MKTVFTKEEILRLMHALQIQIIAEEGGFIFAKRAYGWSKDTEIGQLQAKLSILLEIAEAS